MTLAGNESSHRCSRPQGGLLHCTKDIGAPEKLLAD